VRDDRSPRILVADDVPANGRLPRSVLAPRGYEVLAADGAAAVPDLVESEHPDLVPLDVAGGGQILITQRSYAEVETEVEAEPAGEFALKGFGRPVAVGR
jgi:DNA-binding NtrC family response regulator